MPGDGKENLIPLNKRTKEEQRPIQVMGGKKSGEARRRKRDTKAALTEVLKCIPQLPPDLRKSIERMGVKGKGKEHDRYDVLLLSMAALGTKCMKGDVQALRLMLEIMGEDAQTKLARERMEAEAEAKRQPEFAPEDSPAYVSFLDALDQKAGDAFDDGGEDIPAGLSDSADPSDAE